MPTKTPRIRLVVREILTRLYVTEDRFWAKEGEERLKTFDPATAVSHEKVWS
jgi:hypothetical protein